MRRGGFTLIELLVVITILAILAGAALPYVQSYVEESRIAKAKTDLEEIGRALAVYETREGDYMKVDVSDLTGRYLNKAPINPWGKPYIVATDSGTVKSSGPDRQTGNAQNNADDISVPYQPPLSLVQAKWIDKNQTGAVDTQNTNDQVQLIFSRKVKNSIGDFATALTLDKMFAVSTGTMSAIFIAAQASCTSLASKAIVLSIQPNLVSPFTPGSDSIQIKSGHATLEDMSGNLALASQSVIILPQ